MEKRLVAPAVITALIILFCIGFAVSWFILFHDVDFLVMIIGLAIVLVIIWVSVLVLWERVKEIRSGEEDDLGKY